MKQRVVDGLSVKRLLNLGVRSQEQVHSRRQKEAQEAQEEGEVFHVGAKRFARPCPIYIYIYPALLQLFVQPKLSKSTNFQMVHFESLLFY